MWTLPKSTKFMRVDLLSVSLLDCHYANESPKEYVNGLIEPKKSEKERKTQ